MEPVDLRQARKQFSRIGLGAFVILIVTYAVTALLSILLFSVLDLKQTELLYWLLNFVPLYLAGMPLGLLVMKKVPAYRPEQRKLTPGKFFITLAICVFLIYASNFVGMGILALLEALTGHSSFNPVTEMTATALPLRILFTVIIAPIMEEFIFRKQLIDRMRIYGEKTAVVATGLIFGLFHGNLSQFCYAFVVGCAFGYIYLRTGKLRYSVAIHMTMNLLGSVIAPMVEESAGSLQAPGFGLLLTVLFSLTIYGLFITGLVLLCVYAKRIRFAPMPKDLPKGKVFSTAYLNVGILLLIAGCLASIVAMFFV